MEFPLFEDFIPPDTTEYEREYLRTEYGWGLSNYLKRLDTLMLKGQVVLDAGCGAGQWSIALAQRFEKVEAIDLSRERLSVLRSVAAQMRIHNINISQGSVERLPYLVHSFDAIFCYGVIMLAPVAAVLAEFYRVLRPGGRIYICLNGDGWSHYLIDVGRELNPKFEELGRRTLYMTYFHRAVQNGLRQQLREVWRNRSECQRAQLKPPKPMNLIDRIPTLRRIWKKENETAPPVNEKTPDVARQLLAQCELGASLVDQIARVCGEKYIHFLFEDCWALIDEEGVPLRFGLSRAYRPEELLAMVRSLGFCDFQWSIEGTVICSWHGHAPPPRYEGYFKNDISVWECLFAKPAQVRLFPLVESQFLENGSIQQGPVCSIERHFHAAREARRTSVFVEQCPTTVLSNASNPTYPQHLLEQAKETARCLGGDAYLKSLVKTLIQGASSEEDVIRQLIIFVQRAIFRDPVSQPLEADGALPDALTNLVCARGRCSHVSEVLTTLIRLAGLDAHKKQLIKHVVVEAKCAGRWIIADCDAFKNSVIPVDRNGQYLTLEGILENPYWLDRFTPTGWMLLPGSRNTRGVFGHQIHGYVDALWPDERGFVSRYYTERSSGTPPSLPILRRFESSTGRFLLEWSPSTVRDGNLLGYRVALGSRSRNWSYYTLGDGDEILTPPPGDVLSIETLETAVEGSLPSGVSLLFASVTAFSDRIENEPQTYFWPSEEAVCVL
jgi:SAM-dependent methyltransferase